MTTNNTADQFLQAAIEFSISENYERALECLVDYHTNKGGQRNLLEAENIKAYLEDKHVALTEEVTLDSIVEALATAHGGKYVITTHAPIPGIPEHNDIVNVHVPDEIADHLNLGKYDEERDYGKTDRVTVTNRDTGDTAHFHVYPYDRHDNKTEYVVRSIGNKEKPAHHWEHKNVLINHLKGELSEDIDAIDSWKHEVHKTYPEHAGRMRFVSKENGKHISAEVPGVDRSFGVYDLEKNQGHVLNENNDNPESTLAAIKAYKSDLNNMIRGGIESKYHYERVKSKIAELQQKYDRMSGEESKNTVNESEDIDSADYEETDTGRKARAHHLRFKDEEDEEKILESAEEEEDEDDPKVRFAKAMAAVDGLARRLNKRGLPPTGATYDQWSSKQPIHQEPKKVEEAIVENLKEIDGKWALVSKKDPSKVLQYYRGEGKPSDEWVKKVERRVHMFEQDETLPKCFLSLTEGSSEELIEDLKSKLEQKAKAKIDQLRKQNG